MGVPAPGRRSGRVSWFDVRSGLGEVADEGGNPWPFHGTAVADGSRRIDVASAVVFDLVPGRAGRWEASDLRPTS